MTDVAVTVGASQALHLGLQAACLTDGGDEVIAFEPFFDFNIDQIKLAGGTPTPVPLAFAPYDDNNNNGGSGEWILEKDVF